MTKTTLMNLRNCGIFNRADRTETRELLRRSRLGCLLVGALWAALPVQRVSALTWQYFTTDGANSISGRLTTDGTYSDTIGTGTHVFTVLSFDSFFANGVDAASQFGNGVPSFPVPGQNQITYDQANHSVASLQGTALFGDRTNPSDGLPGLIIKNPAQPSDIVVSRLLDFSDFVPFVVIGPTTTILTPIPDLPAPPTGLTAIRVSESAVQLAWSDNADNESAYVVQLLCEGGSAEVIATLPANSANYTDTTATPCASCTYVVRAISPSGSSPDSNPASTPADVTPPSITCPANVSVGCGLDRLAVVSFPAPVVSDSCDASPSVTCTPASGTATFPVGVTTVLCRAADASGNASTCSFTVTRAALGFTGFLSPIGGEVALGTGGSFADPLRAFKLGSTIPIKFVATCYGSPVTPGAHTLQAVKYSSLVDSDPAIDATPTDGATTGNQFRLTDAASGEWHFNLSTKPMSVGTWKLTATLSDGSVHEVWITIKK